MHPIPSKPYILNMNLFKAFTSVLAAASIALPVSAGSFSDSKALLEMIEATGTKVSVNTNQFDNVCTDKAGYYQYKKDVIDVLVICQDQVNINDPDELWEVVAHESTHVAQACLGSNIFEETYLPRIFRALSTKAPHYSKMVDSQYSAEDAIYEAEAFWMELQSPKTVMKVVHQACFNQADNI